MTLPLLAAAAISRAQHHDEGGETKESAKVSHTPDDVR